MVATPSALRLKEVFDINEKIRRAEIELCSLRSEADCLAKLDRAFADLIANLPAKLEEAANSHEASKSAKFVVKIPIEFMSVSVSESAGYKAFQDFCAATGSDFFVGKVFPVYFHRHSSGGKPLAHEFSVSVSQPNKTPRSTPATSRSNAVSLG